MKYNLPPMPDISTCWAGMAWYRQQSNGLYELFAVIRFPAFGNEWHSIERDIPENNRSFQNYLKKHKLIPEDSQLTDKVS